MVWVLRNRVATNDQKTESKSDFHMWLIFDGFWDRLGTNFGVILTTFSRSGPSNWSTVFRVCFLLLWDWTWHQDAMSGCARNIILVPRFRADLGLDLVGKVWVLGVRREALGFILGGFWWPWAHLFCCFWGYRKEVGILKDFWWILLIREPRRPLWSLQNRIFSRHASKMISKRPFGSIGIALG